MVRQGRLVMTLTAAVTCIATGSAMAQFDECPNENGGNCHEVTPGIGGCCDEACCNEVSAVDPACCLIEWDEVCVVLAVAFDCGASCGPADLLSFNVVAGELLAGDLQSLEESDDDYVKIYAQLSNLATAYVSRTLITAMSPATTVSGLDLTLETGVSATPVLTRVVLRNFDTGDWDLLGAFSQSEADSETMILEVPNPNAYVNDELGQIRVRIETRANAAQVPDGYVFRIDHVQLAITAGEGGGIAGGDNALPCDLDGDDNVSTGDLILLLGSWGDPYGTADLIELLGNWGPCPK